MDSDAIAEIIAGLARSIHDGIPDRDDLVIAGVPTRGVEVARRIAIEMEKLGDHRLEVGAIDVSMHRDDLARLSGLRAVVETSLPTDLNDRVVLLVDDVLFTGRSCKAALEALWSYGRPAAVRFAVLVDRPGHLELPIRADFVGRSLKTTMAEKIRVRFENLDGVPDSVQIVGP